MTAADLAARLRERVAQLVGQLPDQQATAQQENDALEAAQRAGNLADVMTAQARASAAQGIADQAAADLLAAREELAQAEADQGQQERQRQAEAADLLAERLAAEIDRERAAVSSHYARLLGLEQLHAQAARQVRAELAREVAQPGVRPAFLVALANLYHPVARIDPETLAALD